MKTHIGNDIFVEIINSKLVVTSDDNKIVFAGEAYNCLQRFVISQVKKGNLPGEGNKSNLNVPEILPLSAELPYHKNKN